MGSTAHSYEFRFLLASPHLEGLGPFENDSAATIFTYMLSHFLYIIFGIFWKSHYIILHNAPLHMSFQEIPRNSVTLLDLHMKT